MFVLQKVPSDKKSIYVVLAKKIVSGFKKMT